MIGPGGLAAEAPGGEAEGGVRRRGHGGEKEAVWQLRAGSAEEPALEAAAAGGARTGELLRADDPHGGTSSGGDLWDKEGRGAAEPRSPRRSARHRLL